MAIQVVPTPHSLTSPTARPTDVTRMGFLLQLVDGTLFLVLEHPTFPSLSLLRSSEPAEEVVGLAGNLCEISAW